MCLLEIFFGILGSISCNVKITFRDMKCEIGDAQSFFLILRKMISYRKI